MKVLFICHGNICRSVAAEMVLRQMIEEEGLTGAVAVASAAATREEIGNDIYPPMRKALVRAGVPCHPHAARLTTREDAVRFDLLIGMDEENLDDMRRIYGREAEDKTSLLLDWAETPGREISDPWYTRDFDGCLREIVTGCRGLLQALRGGSLQPESGKIDRKS